MRKVLILAYYFPPLGMGGTQRTAKFAKYLPDFNWQPIVVTVKNVAYFAYDETLLADVANIEIHRTGSLDPLRLAYLVSRLRRKTKPENFGGGRQIFSKLCAFFFMPDSKLLWLPFAFFRCFKILSQNKIDCIFTTSPPHSVHLLGRVLRILFGVHWVADFRDGWVDGNFQEQPTRLHRWVNKRLQKWTVRGADKVIGVSSVLLEKIARETMVSTDKLEVITNGYDRADFEKLSNISRGPSFMVVYCGALTQISPVTSFLQALSNLLEKRPEFKNLVKVKFVGTNLNVELEDMVASLRLSSVVDFMGYCEHSRALQYVQAADLLLYPIAPYASDDFVPGKTFEYLASGNRILAIGPKVEGMRILLAACDVGASGAKLVTHLDHTDLLEIEKVLGNFFEAGSMSAPQKFAEPGLAKFERRELTRKLSDVLAGDPVNA